MINTPIRPGGPSYGPSGIAIFLFSFFLLSGRPAQAQWTQPDASNNIHNTNTGNVGIQTSNPQALLDLGPGGGVKSLFYGSGGNTGYYWGTGVNLGQSPNEASIFIGGAAGTCCGTVNFAVVSANQSAWPYSSYTTRFVVNSYTGYVGIGTIAPSRLLDLSGSGNWSGSGGFRLTGNNPGIELADGPSGQRWVMANGVVAANDGFLGLAYNVTTATHDIVVTKTDQVGIGTYSPGSFKLAVEGSIGARKLVVTQLNPWPDYVFKMGYQLLPLDSLSAYIRANHHLPEVISADSAARNGLDLGSNQEVLLKKIEELTLYMITQNRKIDALTRRIKKLEIVKK